MIPKFLGSWTSSKNLPKTDKPEFALVGRSNVGKSSLINMITGFGKLARTSNTPGRTRMINMFDLEKTILTDLPGYGYAAASKTDIKEFGKTLGDYLMNRRDLQRVLLLIDSRRGFMPIDIDIMNLFDDIGTSYQIVLTKIDKIPKKDLPVVIENIKTEIEKRPAARPEVISSSSDKKIGREELLNTIGLC